MRLKRNRLLLIRPRLTKTPKMLRNSDLNWPLKLKKTLRDKLRKTDCKLSVTRSLRDRWIRRLLSVLSAIALNKNASRKNKMKKTSAALKKKLLKRLSARNLDLRKKSRSNPRFSVMLLKTQTKPRLRPLPCRNQSLCSQPWLKTSLPLKKTPTLR